MAGSATGILAGLATSILPLALDGESATEAGGNNTALAVISLVSVVACYLLLFALWRFVFSPNARKRHRKGSSE